MENMEYKLLSSTWKEKEVEGRSVEHTTVEDQLNTQQVQPNPTHNTQHTAHNTQLSPTNNEGDMRRGRQTLR